jgi:beta-phosphoglucomutase-like phosphatase (HAD superfamily)
MLCPVAQALEDRWHELKPWDGAQDVLASLHGRTKLAAVTNCSKRLGILAADCLKTHWDCVVTAEQAGYYKPNPRPYRLALEHLGVAASDAAFVAGSGFDLIGTSAVGLRTYWHNRVGLKRPEGAPPPNLESPTLEALIPCKAGAPDVRLASSNQQHHHPTIVSAGPAACKANQVMQEIRPHRRARMALPSVRETFVSSANL